MGVKETRVDSSSKEPLHGKAVSPPLGVASKVAFTTNGTPIPKLPLNSSPQFALQIVPSALASPESPWPYRVVQSARTSETPERSAVQVQVADYARTHSPSPTPAISQFRSQSASYLQPQFPIRLQASCGSAVVPVASPRQHSHASSGSAVVPVASPRQQSQTIGGSLMVPVASPRQQSLAETQTTMGSARFAVGHCQVQSPAMVQEQQGPGLFPIASRMVATLPAPLQSTTTSGTVTQIPSVLPTLLTNRRASETDVLFDKLDKNHDGVVSREEFRSAVKSHIVGPMGGKSA